MRLRAVLRAVAILDSSIQKVGESDISIHLLTSKQVASKTRILSEYLQPKSTEPTRIKRARVGYGCDDSEGRMIAIVVNKTQSMVIDE